MELALVGRAFRRVEFFPPRVIYAEVELHRAIVDRFGYRGGTFFEAGANDGVKASNTVYLEKYLGWTGILVEPIADKAHACRRNRPHAMTFRAALVPFAYPEPTLEIAYANLMSLSDLSDIPMGGHLEAARPHMNGDGPLLGKRYTVPARTAQSVIDAAGNPEIDLFILDVEGAERSVLEGIDFARTRPQHMLIEARNPGEIAAFLAGYGYGPPERLTAMDYLFAAH